MNLMVNQVGIFEFDGKLGWNILTIKISENYNICVIKNDERCITLIKIEIEERGRKIELIDTHGYLKF